MTRVPARSLLLTARRPLRCRARRAVACPLLVLAAFAGCKAPDAPPAAYTIRDTSHYDGALGAEGTLGALYRQGVYVDTIDAGYGVHHVPGGIVYLPVRCDADREATLCEPSRAVHFDGVIRRGLAEFVPLFGDHAAPNVVDSVLYYWSHRLGAVRENAWVPADFIAGRYDFRTGRADTLYLFSDRLDITEYYSLGHPPRAEGELIQYRFGDSVAWLDRDFRRVHRSRP